MTRTRIRRATRGKPLSSPADRIEDPDGDNPQKDDPTVNNSSEEFIFVDGPHGIATEATIVLQFDLTSIPANANVVSATLRMWNGNKYNENHTTTVHAMLPANDGWDSGESSWNWAHETNGQRWAGDVGENGGDDAGASVSGTDYNASVMGQLDYIKNTKKKTSHSAALDAATAQGWVSNPPTNYGVVMVYNLGKRPFEWYGPSSKKYPPVLDILYTTVLCEGVTGLDFEDACNSGYLAAF